MAEDGVLDERIQINEKCTQLSNNMANEAFQEIQELIKTPQEGINNIENFAMKVVSEEVKEDGKVWEKAVITSDWTLVRKPEENPFIIGMMEVRDELTDEQDIAYANEMINGWLVEFESYYSITDENREEVYIVFEPDSERYELFYHYRYEGIDEMVPLEEYSEEHWGEDAEFRKEMGRERLKEELENRE